MFWGVSTLKCSVFQKTTFSRFSIDWTCCSTNRKSDKNLCYNLLGSIGAGLNEIDFWSIEPNFQPIEIQFDGFLKIFFFHVFFTLFNFSKKLFALSLRPIHLKPSFCHFLPNFSQRILSSSANISFLPLLFLFIHIFHAFFIHFRCNFWT